MTAPGRSPEWGGPHPANPQVIPQLPLKDAKMETRDGSGDEEPVICLGGCGRTLTSPESLARGYGSDCWRKLHRRTTRRPRVTAPRTGKPGRGQPELPIDEQLDLWSTE